MGRVCKETVRAALLALALAGCTGGPASDESSPGAAAELTIEVRAGGGRTPAKRWTLECDPAGGTLPRAARACERLDALREPFTSPPTGEICTQIYGGPQTARVTGRFRGRRVDAEFSRTNGCEISRWNRLRFLFPVRI